MLLNFFNEYYICNIPFFYFKYLLSYYNNWLQKTRKVNCKYLRVSEYLLSVFKPLVYLISDFCVVAVATIPEVKPLSHIIVIHYEFCVSHALIFRYLPIEGINRIPDANVSDILTLAISPLPTSKSTTCSPIALFRLERSWTTSVTQLF